MNQWRVIMKSILAVFSVFFFAGCGTAYGLVVNISGDEYLSPGKLFRVNVPVMRNAFVKKPSVIRDELRPAGGGEVNFSVPNLGEAWRFGARPLSDGSPIGITILPDICDEELGRWHSASSKPPVILEETIQLADGPGVVRIYYVKSGSLLPSRRGGADPAHQDALVGVVAVISENKRAVLYAVGQFDEPMNMFSSMVEKAKMDRDTVLKMFARDHLKRLRELTTTLRLQ